MSLVLRVTTALEMDGKGSGVPGAGEHCGALQHVLVVGLNNTCAVPPPSVQLSLELGG